MPLGPIPESFLSFLFVVSLSFCIFSFFSRVSILLPVYLCVFVLSLFHSILFVCSFVCLSICLFVGDVWAVKLAVGSPLRPRLHWNHFRNLDEEKLNCLFVVCISVFIYLTVSLSVYVTA